MLPLIHPQLTIDQSTKIKNLLNISATRTSKLKGSDSNEIHTVDDLKSALGLIEDVEMQGQDNADEIWTLAKDNIDWSKCPIGMEIF